MQRLPATKEQIELMLIAELQTFPNCGQALAIIVVPVEERSNVATWTVSRFNYGRSDGEACDRALQEIVPRFQHAYDMVRKH